jgi:hypothetical protein
VTSVALMYILAQIAVVPSSLYAWSRFECCDMLLGAP